MFCERDQPVIDGTICQDWKSFMNVVYVTWIFFVQEKARKETVVQKSCLFKQIKKMFCKTQSRLKHT